MSQTYPYNQLDQAYPLNQLYQQMVNYVNQQVSSVSVQTINCTPQNVQATWQTCLADPVQLRTWIDTNQLTIDQAVAYLGNWWQTHAGKYVYTQQLNQDYYALPASYGVPVPPLLPWIDLINSNNMSLQAISGLFGSQYLAYTSYMNLMGSGLPLAVNVTNWAGAIAFAPPSYVSAAAPGIGISISNLGMNNVTNLAMVISNPIITYINAIAQIISYPTINITGMAMIVTNPAVNITYMAYVLSSPAINYTNVAPIITVSAINATTMAYIATTSPVNITSIIYMYAMPTAQPAGIYYTLSNANVSATYAQSIYYSMASVAVTYDTESIFIGFVTYNQPAVTLSANVSATWTLFYSSLDLAGYTLTMGTTGRPSVIVTYAIQVSGGAIVQQPTGAPGGYAALNNYGGAGGGGLVIVAVTGTLDGSIIAVGSSGSASVTTNSTVANGSAGGGGYIITIEGKVYTASTGGPGGSGTDCMYSSGGGGGGGYYGGLGGSGYSSAGPGGSVVSTLNYSTRWSYVYTMLQFLGDEWQRYVLGRMLPTYVGATYLAGYGSGGGGGGSVSVWSHGGGGGGMGGQVVIYMHNLYAPTANNIIAMGGTGGAAYPCGCGGGGGAGGLVYILTHNLVAFSGTIDVLGGIGMTGVNDSAGGRGTANTYAIFIV